MIPEFAKWHGINRSEIRWHPIMDPNKCTECGLCVVTCSEKRNVFGFNVLSHKAEVLFPDNCVVGCNNCQVSCLWNAISYPEDIDYIRKLTKGISKEILAGELREKLEKNPEMVE